MKHVLFAILVTLSICFGTKAQTTSSYDELQAAYLYNFIKYIKWPKEPASFVIGIFGGKENEVMLNLQNTLRGKKVAGKEIIVRDMMNSDQILDCNIIYLSEAHSDKLHGLLEVIEGRSILIVTETDLIRKGATISFVVYDDRLQFKIRKSAFSKAGLIASEGLLRLAILL